VPGRDVSDQACSDALAPYAHVSCPLRRVRWVSQRDERMCARVQGAGG
jgi:hypothetical protein